MALSLYCQLTCVHTSKMFAEVEAVKSAKVPNGVRCMLLCSHHNYEVLYFSLACYTVTTYILMRKA